MRLVDGEQGDGHGVQQFQRARLQQTLGGDVEQVQAPGTEIGFDLHHLLVGERRVQHRGTYAGDRERADLVVHQRDQR